MNSKVALRWRTRKPRLHQRMVLSWSRRFWLMETRRLSRLMSLTIRANTLVHTMSMMARSMVTWMVCWSELTIRPKPVRKKFRKVLSTTERRLCLKRLRKVESRRRMMLFSFSTRQKTWLMIIMESLTMSGDKSLLAAIRLLVFSAWQETSLTELRISQLNLLLKDS